MITCTIEAHEEIDLDVIYIQGSYLHANTDEHVSMLLKFRLSDMMSMVDPNLYRKSLVINIKVGGGYVKIIEGDIWFTWEFIIVLQDANKVLIGGRVSFEPV